MGNYLQAQLLTTSEMRKYLSYIIVACLLAIGSGAIYAIFKAEPQPQSKLFITRAPADSTTVAEYIAARAKEPVEANTIRWNEITAMIVSITIAVGTLNLKQFKTKIFDEINGIKTQLQTVADQKDRDDLDKILVKIEQDAAGFVDDENVKALIEGIGTRTRRFSKDVMNLDFSNESFETARLKMSARAQDCKHQIKDLGFSNYFETQMNVIRNDHMKRLTIDLKRLVNDKIHNSKYQRFGEIISRFLRNYLKDVIKLSIENK